MKPRSVSAAIRSTLLLFCVIFPVQFLMFILHEGGHALNNLTRGGTVTIFYVHPFTLDGYVRPLSEFSTVWRHASGTVVSLLASLLIFILLWKRRSVAILPLIMLFPWVAIIAGMVAVITTPGNTGDYYNISQLTGIPGVVFFVPGILLLLLGILLFASGMPLLGLDPRDWRTLLIVPASLLLWSAVSILVARLCVPGSPIDVQFQLGKTIVQSANIAPLWTGTLAMLIAGIYVGPYRWINPKLPAWLRTEVADLTWKDLRLPAFLAAVSVIVGLIIIT